MLKGVVALLSLEAATLFFGGLNPWDVCYLTNLSFNGQTVKWISDTSTSVKTKNKSNKYNKKYKTQKTYQKNTITKTNQKIQNKNQQKLRNQHIKYAKTKNK